VAVARRKAKVGIEHQLTGWLRGGVVGRAQGSADAYFSEKKGGEEKRAQGKIESHEFAVCREKRQCF